nr:hypothetical protein CQW23_31795 [Ipomoea trifida]
MDSMLSVSASNSTKYEECFSAIQKALSDQGLGHKGPGTIQVRRTPDVTAMSRNLTHGPKREKTVEHESKGSPNEWTSSKGGGRQEPCFQRSGGPNLI